MEKSRTELSKEHFLNTAFSYLGTPYIWGGDDPSGFDCSGYVIECLKTIGMLSENQDFSAEALHAYLLHHLEFKTKKISKPERGSLLFYRDKYGKVSHVTICLDQYFQIGAAGGDSKTSNPQIASLKNAYVKIRPIPKNMKHISIISLFNQ